MDWEISKRLSVGTFVKHGQEILLYDENMKMKFHNIISIGVFIVILVEIFCLIIRFAKVDSIDFNYLI